MQPAFRERIAADNAYDLRLYEFAKRLSVREAAELSRLCEKVYAEEE